MATRGVTHEVYVLCSCADLEHCRMELYVSDVRIAARMVELLETELELLQEAAA